MRTLITIKNIEYEGYNQVSELLFEFIPTLVLNDKYLSSKKEAYFLIEGIRNTEFVTTVTEFTKAFETLVTELGKDAKVEAIYSSVDMGSPSWGSVAQLYWDENYPFIFSNNTESDIKTTHPPHVDDPGLKDIKKVGGPIAHLDGVPVFMSEELLQDKLREKVSMELREARLKRKVELYDPEIHNFKNLAELDEYIEKRIDEGNKSVLIRVAPESYKELLYHVSKVGPVQQSSPHGFIYENYIIMEGDV